MPTFGVPVGSDLSAVPDSVDCCLNSMANESHRNSVTVTREVSAMMSAAIVGHHHYLPHTMTELPCHDALPASALIALK
ncbi:MAG: hypothetical protein GZ090_07305 [Oxalobacteraceae bacterium]|nr:hypothetical protein [Oxalobacteraceae bacterium]